MRESFITGYDIDENENIIGDKKVWYRATDHGFCWYDSDSESTLDNPPWKPSIHMPRWANRITLTVTDVRVQRLQDIRENDAMAEGAPPVLVPPDGGSCPHVEGFRDIWNTIHGPEAWDANPWVAAISFTVQHGNIDGDT